MQNFCRVCATYTTRIVCRARACNAHLWKCFSEFQKRIQSIWFELCLCVCVFFSFESFEIWLRKRFVRLHLHLHNVISFRIFEREKHNQTNTQKLRLLRWQHYRIRSRNAFFLVEVTPPVYVCVRAYLAFVTAYRRLIAFIVLRKRSMQ